MAIKHDLFLVWELGFRHVICESDSLDEIRMLDAPPLTSHLIVLLMEIVDISTRLWRVFFHHILQESNICAEKLVLLGLCLQFAHQI